MPSKINVHDHLEDTKLELSMLNLSDVPVKEIASYPKATTLDLSNNCLTTLGKTFATSLTHLIELDLAQNKLTSLPDNFGLLVNLRHLDLYNNQLTCLPLSVGNLKHLRWLDLKQNPLLPKLAQIAGPCLDSAQCSSAAKNVVELLSLMNKQVEEEKKRLLKEQMDQEDEEKKLQLLKKDQQLNQPKKKNKKKKSKDQAPVLENGSVKEEALKDVKEEKGAAGDVDPSLEHSENKLINGEVDGTGEPETQPQIESRQRSSFSKICSCIGFLFTVAILTVCIVWFGVFLLRLLDENYYNLAVNHLTKVQRHLTSQFPKTWVKKANRMLVQGSKSATRLTNRMLKFCAEMIQSAQDWQAWVNTDETVLTYLETVKSCWQVLWIRITEMYRTIFV